MRNAQEKVFAFMNCFTVKEPVCTLFPIEVIQQVIQDGTVEERLWLAKAMVHDGPSELTITSLKKLATDLIEDVRIEAIDSISNYPCRESFSVLCSATTDSCELVRAYAAVGLAVVGKIVFPSKAQAVLLSMAGQESSNRVRISIYEGLCILGADCYLKELFQLFMEEDYCNQCAILNALAEIENPSNQVEIIHFLESLDIATYSTAVSCTIDQIIKKTGDGSLS